MATHDNELASLHFLVGMPSEIGYSLQFLVMNRITHQLLVAGVITLALTSRVHADAQVALDYHSKVKGCPSSDRFADEVSAKLGFVPWDAQAQTAIRVRIAEDSGDFVGTLEQPDGTSKVLRAPTCAKLDEALVSAIAVALDRPATADAKHDDRRLQTLDRGDPDALVTVELKSKDGRELEISRVLSATMLYAGISSAAAVQFEKLCTAPCTARLPQGTHTFLVRDVANNYTVSKDATLRVSSTLELDYTSRAETRRTSLRRIKWGLLIGFLAGTAASAYFVETESPTRALHALDPVGGSLGMLVGGLIGAAVGPGTPGDDARIDVRPGLTTAASF